MSKNRIAGGLMLTAGVVVLMVFFLVGIFLNSDPRSDAGGLLEDYSFTTARRWLAAEYEAKQGQKDAPSEEDYLKRVALLDKIIDDAVRRIRRLKFSSMNDEAVLQQFDTVNRVLVDHHFNVYVPTEIIWDAMTPGIPDDHPLRHGMTEQMKAHRLANPEAEYYRFDCDTGSAIYLSVFEVLEAPVVMVMVPQHAFVRWRLHANHHVNWDVNAGDSFSDDEYRKGIASIPFGSDTEERNKFLKDMTADELEGFHRILLADEYRRSGQLDDAIEAFRLALQYQPSNPAVHNNYARMIATERALQQADLLDEALDHAKKAVALLPNDEGIIDTLAVVHAARGEFERAIEVEMTGLKSPDRLTAYYLHIHPADTDWKDQESVPFEY